MLATLSREVFEKGCFFNRQACPLVHPFLLHHVCKVTGLTLGRKVRSMAGNRIWWVQLGDDRYVLPDGVRVTEIVKAENGEVWHLENSLQL